MHNVPTEAIVCCERLLETLMLICEKIYRLGYFEDLNKVHEQNKFYP